MRDAIRGLRTLFSSKGVKLVPLNEMVDAITVRRQAKKDIGACGGGGPGGEGKYGGEVWRGSMEAWRWVMKIICPCMHAPLPAHAAKNTPICGWLHVRGQLKPRIYSNNLYADLVQCFCMPRQAPYVLSHGAGCIISEPSMQDSGGEQPTFWARWVMGNPLCPA